MEDLIRLKRMSLTLAIMVVVCLALSALALTDIYHNEEASLAMEWNMVRVMFLIVLMFTVLSSITILKLSRNRDIQVNE